MNQFDYYVNTDKDTYNTYPYFVDVQTDLLATLNSRVVIPLTQAQPEKYLPNNLCPTITINGEPFYLLSHQITTVSARFLKKKQGSLLLDRIHIINSIDFLFSGI